MSLLKQTDKKFLRRLLKQSEETCIDHKHNYTKIISELQNVIQPFRTDICVYVRWNNIIINFVYRDQP